MRQKITSSLINSLRPQEKPFEVNDTELKGFLLRVQPTGVMSYYLSYRNQNAKRHRVLLGKHPAMSAAQARDRAREMLGKVFSGEDPAHKAPASSIPTLGHFLEHDYEPWAITHLRQRESAGKRIRSAFDEVISQPITELTPNRIERWRTKRLAKGIKATTVNREIAALRAMLSKAQEWGFIQQHPLQLFKLTRTDPNAVVRFLSKEEELALRKALDKREKDLRARRQSGNQWRAARGKALLDELDSSIFVDHLKPMVLLSINTGLRQGELFNLEWSDIDLEHTNLTVRGDVAKSGKTRHLPLNMEALTVLKDWATQTGFTGYVFQARDGGPFDNVRKAWTAVLSDAGIKNFRWHDLRHHFASRLVMAGVDLNTVRELLGHGDLKMTLRYAHLAPEHKAAAVAKLITEERPEQ